MRISDWSSDVCSSDLVAPTVWAWRPGRARKIAPLFRHLLTLLPFEPPLFERWGLATTYVGHPVLETVAAVVSERPAGRGVAPDAPRICLLPGSRRGEQIGRAHV